MAVQWPPLTSTRTWRGFKLASIKVINCRRCSRQVAWWRRARDMDLESFLILVRHEPASCHHRFAKLSDWLGRLDTVLTLEHIPTLQHARHHRNTPTQVNKTVRRDGEYRFYPFFLALEGSMCWFETSVVGVGVEKPFETVDVGLFGWMRLEWFFSFWCPLM